MQKNNLKKIINLAASIFVVWLIINALFLPHYSYAKFNTLIILCFALIVSIAYFILAMALFVPKRHPGSRGILHTLGLVGIFTILFAIHLWVGHALASTLPGWDVKFVFDSAAEIANSHHLTLTSYFSTYPNNVGLLFLLTVLFKAVLALGSSNFLTAAIILNIIFMNMAGVFTYLSARKLYGSRIALLSLPLVMVFVTFSMWSAAPYSDTIAIAFPVLIFYLYLCARQTNNIRTQASLWFFIGCLAYFGYKIKPTVIIILIALILAGLIELVSAQNRNRKHALITFAFCAIGITSSSQIFNYMINNSGVLPDNVKSSSMYSRPVSYFIMMGLQERKVSNDTTFYGAYNPQDNGEDMLYKTTWQKNEHAKKEIHQRLAEKGVTGYLSYLTHKGSWILSDGTFFAYGEGPDATQVKFFNNDSSSVRLRALMYPGGEGYRLFTAAIQVVWIMILIALLIQFMIVTKGFLTIEILTLKLAIAGLLGAVLLLEGRSRYLYLYIPIFIILSLATVHRLRQAITVHRHKHL